MLLIDYYIPYVPITSWFWMLGDIKWGIILIFIPLLTLSTDVMSKFMCANLSFGVVIIRHLDKLYDANKPAYKDLLQRSGAFFAPQQRLCSYFYLLNF